eukprot:g33428.t1
MNDGKHGRCRWNETAILGREWHAGRQEYRAGSLCRRRPPRWVKTAIPGQFHLPGHWNIWKLMLRKTSMLGQDRHTGLLQATSPLGQEKTSAKAIKRRPKPKRMVLK